METTYSLKEVLRTLGISRTTLLYYEKQGIISVRKNPTNGYRYFYHDDINVLKQCIWLKNLGYSIAEIVDLIQEGGIFQLERLQVYREKLRQRISYDTAIWEQLQTYEESLSKEFGVPEYSEEIPCYCVLFFGCENGYHFVQQTEASDRLIRQIPLTGFLYRFDAEFWNGEANFKIGRCVQKKYIPLVLPEGKTQKWQEFGGVPAVREKIHILNNRLIPEEIERLKSCIAENGYEVCGDVVSLYNFGGKVIEEMEIIVPVREKAAK